MVEFFKVEVTACEATLSSLSVETPINVVNTWYEPDLYGTNFFLTMSELTQSPDCGYNLVPQLWLTDGNGNLLPPNSGDVNINMDPDTTTIYAEKCTLATQDTDPDCAQSPEELVINYVLVVLLDDGNIGTPDE